MEDERGDEADEGENVSDSNVFWSTAARLLVLISRCDCGSMPLATLWEGRKEKKKNRKQKRDKIPVWG